jgi:hypothetical protein
MEHRVVEAEEVEVLVILLEAWPQQAAGLMVEQET